MSQTVTVTNLFPLELHENLSIANFVYYGKTLIKCQQNVVPLGGDFMTWLFMTLSGHYNLLVLWILHVMVLFISDLLFIIGTISYQNISFNT